MHDPRDPARDSELPPASLVIRTDFKDRADLIAHVMAICPWAEGEASPIPGGATRARELLAEIDPVAYGHTRNFAEGKVTRLSPYVSHGILSLDEIRNTALKGCTTPQHATKFLQELGWRDFWQRVLKNHPEWAWHDADAYKTGFGPEDYADALPTDIVHGETGVASIDAFVRELNETGYLHNHARMYVASYVVHFRRIKWQAGARWFLKHLLDANIASNNLSWQWVASTFSSKPYIFNLENVRKYFGGVVDVSSENNRPLDASYEALEERLFQKRRVAP